MVKDGVKIRKSKGVFPVTSEIMYIYTHGNIYKYIYYAQTCIEGRHTLIDFLRDRH